jgi:hypothetical protein
VSLNKRTYRPGETMSALLILDEEAPVLSGSLMLSRMTFGNAKVAIIGAFARATNAHFSSSLRTRRGLPRNDRYTVLRLRLDWIPVCAENLIHIDVAKESHKVTG